MVASFMTRSAFVKERLIARGNYYYKKQGRFCCKKSKNRRNAGADAWSTTIKFVCIFAKLMLFDIA